MKTSDIIFRNGDWMQTFTGGQFWPTDAWVSDFNIVDVAHSLSLQCRYAGHCITFYSVAEHCVLLSRAVSPPAALWALLHDAQEAFCTDIVRPLKSQLKDYHNFELNLMKLSIQAFKPFYGLGSGRLLGDVINEVEKADERILNDERDQNMHPCRHKWSSDPAPLGVKLHLWAPPQAEAEFLARFAELTNDRSNDAARNAGALQAG